MKLLPFILFSVFFVETAFSQEVEAYQIYNAKGKKISAAKMFKGMNTADFILFGEYHDNPISHWLQFELTKHLYAQHDTNLVLGFEMFEQDQQQLFSDFVAGEIDEKTFEDSCRLWPNYETDYKPLVEFAIESKLRVVADNIPRRYASMMFKYGRDTLNQLSAEEKSWIAPLDFVIDTTLSQYQEVAEMAVHIDGLNGYDLMQAQAIKDATMAFFMLQNMTENNVILHFNGSFHSDFHQGIMWHLLQEKPEAAIITIATVTQSDVTKLEKESIGRADYIICVNENMTSTH